MFYKKYKYIIVGKQWGHHYRNPFCLQSQVTIEPVVHSVFFSIFVFPGDQVRHIQALETSGDLAAFQKSDPSDWSWSIQWPPKPQHTGALWQPPHTGAITCLRVPQQAAGALATQQPHWDFACLCLPPHPIATSAGPWRTQEVGFHFGCSICWPHQFTVLEPGYVRTERHS